MSHVSFYSLWVLIPQLGVPIGSCSCIYISPTFIEFHSSVLFGLTCGILFPFQLHEESFHHGFELALASLWYGSLNPSIAVSTCCGQFWDGFAHSHSVDFQAISSLPFWHSVSICFWLVSCGNFSAFQLAVVSITGGQHVPAPSQSVTD